MGTTRLAKHMHKAGDKPIEQQQVNINGGIALRAISTLSKRHAMQCNINAMPCHAIVMTFRDLHSSFTKEGSRHVDPVQQLLPCRP